MRPAGATLLGGTAALSDAVAAALPGAGRVAGADRASTGHRNRGAAVGRRSR